MDKQWLAIGIIGVLGIATLIILIIEIIARLKMAKQNELTPEEISRAAYERNKLFGENDVLAYTRKPDADECIAKAQLAHTLRRFKKALEQSRKGEPIDLSEEWFELFSAIQNDGVAHKHRLDRPKIICLCGSTRFVDTFNEWRKKLTLEGHIVVSIELVIPQSEREDPQHNNYKVKQMLDELHLRKIDLADEVFVINVNGYIGESTAREIAYAKKLGKPIKYLEETNG